MKKLVGAFVLSASTLFTHSYAFADKPTSEQIDRFEKICMEKKKARKLFCRCFAESNARLANKIEMEFGIARVAGDLEAQKKIKSDPKFKATSYMMKSSSILMNTTYCTQRGGKW